MSITIRKALHEDLPALNGLIEKLGYTKSEDYFEKCFQDQGKGNRVLYIVSWDGYDAGYGILNWHPQYSLYKRLGIPEIQDLNVLHDWRRRGLATALILHCENEAKEQGCSQVGISVGLYPDYGAAQRLYVRLGYVPDGNGVTYDRTPVQAGEIRPVDDDLCLMMVKDL